MMRKAAISARKVRWTALGRPEAVVWLALYFVAILVALRLWAVWARRRTRRRLGIHPKARIVAFFHPHCDAAGGGERVLWRAIHSLGCLSQSRAERLHVIVYAANYQDICGGKDILDKAGRTFHLNLSAQGGPIPISFVGIHSHALLEPKRYPVATILGQSLGSMLVACECLFAAMPDVWLDSTGFAFTMVPARFFFGCSTAAYVHYPTISVDMLSRVRQRSAGYNNSMLIANSSAASLVKWLYYWVFAGMYGCVGCLSQVVMVNSSWTRAHIASLWRFSSPTVVYPPCDTSNLKALPLNERGREPWIVSVGQFRPEKNHLLQLRAFARSSASKQIPDGSRLIIIGGVRNDQDRDLLASLRSASIELGVEGKVDFVVGCSYEHLRGYLGKARAGLHTMRDEHFGIGVVEMMAAGLIVIAHNSGGPKDDIIDQGVSGILAETEEEFSDAICRVLSDTANHEHWSTMRQIARTASEKFSNEIFDRDFAESVSALLGVQGKKAQ